MELCMLMMQEVPACQNQEYVSRWSQLHCFSTLPVSAAQKWFTCKLRDVTPDNFSVSHLFYVFYLSFLCKHIPLPCPVTLLSCLCLPTPLSLFLQLPFSQLLSLFLSPFAPFVWPLCITRSHKDSSLCLLLWSLFFPFIPFSSLFLSTMHCLSCCTTEILFLCFPSSLVLSVSGFYYMHTHFASKHCYSVPLNSSYSMSLLYPRQKYVPRCCVPEVSVKVAHAGTCEMCWTSHAHAVEM